MIGKTGGKHDTSSKASHKNPIQKKKPVVDKSSSKVSEVSLQVKKPRNPPVVNNTVVVVPVNSKSETDNTVVLAKISLNSEVTRTDATQAGPNVQFPSKEQAMTERELLFRTRKTLSNDSLENWKFKYGTVNSVSLTL